MHPAEAPSLMWFRDDLRIVQNEALAAAASHGPVIAVYIMEDVNTSKVRAMGRAAQWWLHHSLNSLIDRLTDHDIPMIIISGDPRDLIPRIAARIDAAYVCWSRRYHQPHQELDAAVKELLRTAQVSAHSFPGQLLAEPWTIATGQGGA